MNTTNRQYESLYIIDPALTEEQVDSIIEKYSTLISEQGGEVQAAGRWEKRRLAYEVMGHRDGAYILMYFTGEAAVAKELDRVFRITDDVFRHIIIRTEPEHVDPSRIKEPGAIAAEEADAATATEAAPPAEATEAAAEEAPAAEAEAEAPAEEAPAAEAEAEAPAEAAPAEEVVAEEAPQAEAEAEPAQEEAPVEEQQAQEPAAEEAVSDESAG